MCKRLDEFLGPDPKRAEKFAQRISVDPFSVRRYRLGQKIPRPDVMIRIVRESGGQVMPNDFYDIPARYLIARYGDQATAALQAAE